MRARAADPGDGPQTVADVLDRAVARAPGARGAGRPPRALHVRASSTAPRTAPRDALPRSVSRRATASPRACRTTSTSWSRSSARCGSARSGSAINRPLAAPEKAYLLQRLRCARCSSVAPDVIAAQVATDDAASCSRRHRAASRRRATTRARPRVAIDPARLRPRSPTRAAPPASRRAPCTATTTCSCRARSRRRRAPTGPTLRQGVLLPLTILNLMVLAPLVAFQDGSALRVHRPDRRARASRSGCARERVGHFAAVPTIFYDLLTHPGVARADLASRCAGPRSAAPSAPRSSARSTASASAPT